MVRGRKSRIDPPLTVRMPPQSTSDRESDLSKHVAIMSGLSEAEERINKVGQQGYIIAC